MRQHLLAAAKAAALEADAAAPRLSRRAFLASSGVAAAALIVGFDPRGALAASPVDAADAALAPNPFVAVDADGVVTVVVKHFEMGQGVTTGLATLVAEELDASWDQMRVVFAPADESRYANLFFGGAQGTGGSTAIANSYGQYRAAGAAARDMLVRAAGAEWGVPAAEITVEDGVLSHPSGASGGFGAFAAAAAALAPPAEPTLKDPSAFKLIGDPNLPRIDNAGKTDGSAQFAMDVRRPGQLTAVIARPPRFGGTIKSVDAEAALAVRGVLAVKETDRGVAVIATSTWPALKGREALSIEWDDAAAETRSTDAIAEETNAALDMEGLTARKDGEGAAALAGAAKTVTADFHFPFLAHAPLEPLNCVIELREGPDGLEAELWDGCQFPTLVRPVVAGALGVPPTRVSINTVWAGGSFGRRATPVSDYQYEAALVAKALLDTEYAGRPVSLVWSREDDIHGGFYRPLYAHRVTAGIDANGQALAWEQRQAGKSILIGTFFEGMLVQDGIDATSVEGASTLPYAIPNLEVSIRNTETTVPVLWWRAVGHTHTAYSTEVMADMLAEAAEQDPVEFRLSLLEQHPRHAGVLRLAAEKAGWGDPLPAGRGRGVAVHESFSSYVAVVVEVSTDEDGAVKIERVVCAVDCGQVVNPDIVKAQMEGGVLFGLGAVMRNEITLTDGVVDQTNYWDYEPIRLTDAPAVEVHIAPSTEAPTGVGEPGTPPAGPALANAIHQATGVRVLSLPMTRNGVTFA